MWCSPDVLAEECLSEEGRTRMHNMLSKMQPIARNRAIMERLPETQRHHFLNLVPEAAQHVVNGVHRMGHARVDARNQGPLAAADALGRLDRVRGAWAGPLERRRTLCPPADDTGYATKKAAARKRTREHMGVSADDQLQEGVAIVSGCGLPPAKRSRRAADLERWCVAGSWALCSTCMVLQPRDMTPACFDTAPSPYISRKACWRCKAKRQHLAPSFEDVPPCLRDLSDDVRSSLGPLVVDVGPELRSWQSRGYRQHACMIRFSWHEKGVRARLAALPEEERARGRAAQRWLRDNNELYQEFCDEHEDFLQEIASPSDVQRRRCLRIIERPGVESATWPWLFWIPELCFSVERGTDPRRRGGHAENLVSLEERMFGRPADDDADGDDTDDDEDAVEDGVRHCVRRSYAAKALGPLLDYGASYEILHYVFDLTLWTTIGARRNLGYDVPMRVMMRDHPSSPLYWKSVHHALIDMVRQCGYPRLFVTQAPYENSFPYHVALETALDQTQRLRGRMAVGESLHLAHVLTEVARGFVTGQNAYPADRAWVRQLLAGRSDEAPGPGRIALMSRIEFQDGSHKAPTQDYHGSGRPHLHFVICAERPEALRLDQVASATIPHNDDDLAGYVRASQLDWHHSTPWPIHVADSTYDTVAQRSTLLHTEASDNKHIQDNNKKGYIDLLLQCKHKEKQFQADHEAGVRAYFPDLLDATKCHQDVQETIDDGALQATVHMVCRAHVATGLRRHNINMCRTCRL